MTTAVAGSAVVAASWAACTAFSVGAIAWCFAVCTGDASAYISRRKAKVEVRKAELDSDARIAEAAARRYEAAARVVDR